MILRLVIGAMLLVTGCALPQSSSMSRGDVGNGDRATAPKRFAAAIMGDPANLFEKFITPGSGQAPGSSTVDGLVHVGLAEADSGGTLRPRLALAVPSLENGLWTVAADGRMVTTWEIQPGAQWHDGVAFTAADLVFSARFGGDPELPIERDLAFDLVEAVESPSPNTVRVRWARPFVWADGLFSTRRGQPVPKHILERPYTEEKARVTHLPYWSEEFVGTGPFKIRDWVRGSHLVLAANDRYVLGAPKIDVIEVKFILDPNAVLAGVLAGSVELTLGGTLALEQTVEVGNQWRDGRVDVWFNNWVALHPQFLNPNPPVVSDQRFRRALLHAIDRQKIVDVLLSGQAPIAESYVNPKTSEHAALSSYIVRYDYDPQRAIEVIEGLGYSRGADGGFRDAANQKLAVEIRGSTVTEIARKTAYPVADEWQRIGVTAELVMPPPQRARDREYRATFPGFELTRGPNELEGIRRYHSSNNAVPENNFAGTNRSRYANAEFDRLIDAFYTTIPRPQRMEILGQIVQHMTGNLVPIGLFHDAQSALVSNRLKNVVGAGGTATQAWNAHEWELQ